MIGQCRFFLGSRMHSCIAALSQGIPCVGLAYSMKFGGVFASVGVEDSVLEARTLDTAEAVEATLECYRRTDATAPGLKNAANSARARLREVFEALRDGDSRGARVSAVDVAAAASS